MAYRPRGIKMNTQTMKYFLAVLIVIVLCSCNGGDGTTNNNGGVAGGLGRGGLVSSTFMESMNSNEIQIEIDAIQDFNVTTVYDVKVYKLVYETVDIDGNAVNASGVVAVPQKNNLPSPLLSYQHGTIFLDCDAPSVLCQDKQYNERYFAIYYASQGYIVVAGDYLGYGDTNNTNHPYHHSDTLASATIDLLAAAKKYLLKNIIAFNNQLFLAGYSEGGYATLETQRTLEESYQSEFSVTASAPGAGAYDILGTAKDLLGTNSPTPLTNPAYVAFVLKAYDTIYNWNAVSSIFQPQYNNIVNTVFDGTNNGDAINLQLTADINQLFTAAFLADLTMRHTENDNAELLWHMGFAKRLKDPDVNGYVIKTGEGHYRLKTGDLTVLRFDGDHGNYSCFVGKGESIHGPETGGNYTYLQVEDWSKWEKKFVYGPYVHHVVGIYGDYRNAMLDACRYLEIKFDSPDS